MNLPPLPVPITAIQTAYGCIGYLGVGYENELCKVDLGDRIKQLGYHMKILSSSLPDVKIISPEIFRDDRGFFYESYRLNLFSELGIPHSFVQDNHSGSRKGILRGLHYQIHQPQGKLLGVIVGKIYDVVVDLRESSETFGKWIGIVLSS